jgi:hypothetical protein
VALAAVYRALLKKYHPDVFVGSKAEAEKRTREIIEAYEVLGNPEKRKAYDNTRKTNGFGSYREEEQTTSSSDDDWEIVKEYYPETAPQHRAQNVESFGGGTGRRYRGLKGFSISLGPRISWKRWLLMLLIVSVLEQYVVRPLGEVGVWVSLLVVGSLIVMWRVRVSWPTKDAEGPHSGKSDDDGEIDSEIIRGLEAAIRRTRQI